MASDKKCCVPGCLDSGNSHQVLHVFPNPLKDPERFNTWVSTIGGPYVLGLTNNHIYKYRRVCHTHFEEKYCCRYNRLSNIAIPTLYIAGPLDFPNTVSGKDNETKSSEVFLENISSTPIGVFGDVERMDVSEPCIESHPICQHSTSGLNSIKVKKPVKAMTKTHIEKMLYRKLLAARVRISKFKNKVRKQAAAVKAAQNIANNPKFLNALENLPKAARILTMLQFRESKKEKKGRRFRSQEKIVALLIFKQSPKAYRLLRKIFILPAPQTLIKLIQQASISPGINKNIFAQLKQQAEMMMPKDKLCLLLFDEIALKANLTYNERTDRVNGFVTNGAETWSEYADHAQVFMIRGLTKNYKQPIGFTFSAAATKGPELAKQIKMFVKEIKDAGFTVVATVCDQGSGNRSAVKYLIEEYRSSCLRKGIEPKDNIISIDEMEIVPLYDTPHLMKCVRNNFISKDLQYGDERKVAKWSHIEALYKENPGYQGIRLMPKLTENHVIPAKISKMKVKYATQLFSQTVATNMGYLADKHILPEEAKATADMLIFFDTLFDSLNGSYHKKHRHAKPSLGPVTPKSVHHKIWKDAKKILKSMKFINKGKTESVPTLYNWAWTLDGVSVLLKKLETQHGVTSIWMRHFNQDPLENFFGSIRSHGCRNTNPTPDRFQSAFAALLINNMTSVHAPGANCENDFAKNLHSLVINEDCIAKSHIDTINIELKELEINIKDLNEKLNNPANKAVLEYCSGYFANVAKQKVFKNCTVCKNDFIANEESEYIKYREFSKKRWLCSPTIELLSNVSQMQDIISETLKNKLHNKCIKEYMKTLILMFVDFDFIKCNKHKENTIECLINSCTRFFVHNYCKNINKIICGRRGVDDREDMLQEKANRYFMKCYRRNK